jgi:hypothetical protein
MFAKLTALGFMYDPDRTTLSDVQKPRHLLPRHPITDSSVLRALEPLRIIDEKHKILFETTVKGQVALVWSQELFTKEEVHSRVAELIYKYRKMHDDRNEYYPKVNSYPDGVNFWQHVLDAEKAVVSGVVKKALEATA